LDEGMRILFLDDNISRHKKICKNIPCEKIVQVYTAKEAIKKLSIDDHFDIIMLDHDLLEDDGLLVVNWLVFNQKYMNTRIIIHSANALGSEIMVKTLKDGGFRRVRSIWSAWSTISIVDSKIVFDSSKESQDELDFL